MIGDTQDVLGIVHHLPVTNSTYGIEQKVWAQIIYFSNWRRWTW